MNDEKSEKLRDEPKNGCEGDKLYNKKGLR